MEATENGSRPWLTVVGSTMIDQIAYAARTPERGETVIGDRFAQGFGGKGANQAVMARLMGAEVAMVNAVGEDSYGTETIANFERFGIDTTYVRREPGSSGVAPIWVEPDGSNRIIVIPGANDGLLPEQGAAAVAEQEHVDAVIGQFEIGQAVTTAAFAAARERGAVTVLNPAPAAAVSAELAAVTDWLIPNEHEFAIIATAAGLSDDVGDPRALAAFAERLGVRLLVTLGERGAAIVGHDGAVRRVKTPTVEAVDTTGAGDAFVGAFAFGLASGRSEAAAARLGCAIAAESVLRPGTQKSFPDTPRCREIIADVAES
ncbi:MAG: ribokinase [Chloroflexota bacterium]|nr:ribokinase [Chloroflexota bacterium]